MSPVAAGGVVALAWYREEDGREVPLIRASDLEACQRESQRKTEDYHAVTEAWQQQLTAAQAEADRLRVDAERLVEKWRDESKVFANIGNQFDAGESWALAKCADDLDTALHAAKTEQENTMELSMNATDAISQHFDDRPVNTEHPLFERIWQAIKGWDIQRVNGAGYAGANGTDVQVIIDAIEQP